MTNAHRSGHPEPDRATWKKAYDLYLHAFKEATTPVEQKKLARILRKPLRPDIAQELFDYNGFLRHLGKMNLSESRFMTRHLFVELIVFAR